MKIRDIVLIIVDHNGGKFIGKTLLQKTIFFLNELLGLGIPFSPHYYGPYSSDVAVAIENLVVLGFLEEIEESLPVWYVWGEGKRYIYRLTQDGGKILEDIKTNPDYDKIVRQLSLIGTFSEFKQYDTLSKAAKIYHIVKAKKKVTSSDIPREADKLGWSLDPQKINELTSFLERLNLVKRVKKVGRS